MPACSQGTTIQPISRKRFFRLRKNRSRWCRSSSISAPGGVGGSLRHHNIPSGRNCSKKVAPRCGHDLWTICAVSIWALGENEKGRRSLRNCRRLLRPWVNDPLWRLCSLSLLIDRCPFSARNCDCLRPVDQRELVGPEPIKRHLVWGAGND